MLKRHGAIPSPQLVNANAMSSAVRAETKYSVIASPKPHEGSSSRSGSRVAMRAMPEASVRPSQYVLPLQSRTATAALGTTAASESRVTQTSDDSRPSFTCTDRFVTSAAERTWNAFASPMSAAPSFGLASSTT